MKIISTKCFSPNYRNFIILAKIMDRKNAEIPVNISKFVPYFVEIANILNYLIRKNIFSAKTNGLIPLNPMGAWELKNIPVISGLTN